MIRSKKWFKASVSLLAAFGSAFIVSCADDNGELPVMVPMSESVGSCEALNNCISSGNVPKGNQSSSSIVSGLSWSQSFDTTWRIDGTDTIRVIDTIYLPPDTSIQWVGQSALRITEIAPLNLDWMDENGDDPSWVELYNSSDKDVDLKGYVLIENLQKLREKDKKIRKFATASASPRSRSSRPRFRRT